MQVSKVILIAVINSKHIEFRQFYKDVREIVLDHVRGVLQKHDALKINTVFNGEFVASDKNANKNITTRNYELFYSICESGMNYAL